MTQSCFDFFAKVLKDPWIRKRYTVPEYCFSGNSKTPNNTNIKKSIKNLLQYTNKPAYQGQKNLSLKHLSLYYNG